MRLRGVRDAALLQLQRGEGGEARAAGDENDVKAEEGDAFDEEEGVGRDAAAAVVVGEVADAAEGGGERVGAGEWGQRWGGSC
jgi:hypothetical protein